MLVRVSASRLRRCFLQCYRHFCLRILVRCLRDPAPTNHITSALTSDMTYRHPSQVFLDFGKPEPRLTTSPHREALRQKGQHRGNQTFCHQTRLMICCPVRGSVGRSSFGEP
ncbi:hypothetical protein CABS03_03237 [Colletotrichum abscissum]|uniref:Uncharacterized protein n=1 Tax=Colletotrichum abscissum TaxID=1671311 RepID=A0A9P9XAJ8_9PEZI|nr:hypothetical protein CABS02_10126 [Colletotrichum abscissum]